MSRIDLEEIARHITDVVVEDLKGRQGFDNLFDSLEPDIWVELYDELVTKVTRVLEGWQIQ